MSSETYPSLLNKIRKYFPQPTSEREHDAYVSSLVFKTLQYLDQKKSQMPYYGKRSPVNFQEQDHSVLPDTLGTIEDILPKLVDVIEGLPIWGHPQMMENVVSSCTIPAIMGTLIASITNPNLLWDEYSHQFAKSELDVIRAMASLVGYDPTHAGGVFTFGGTGTLMYGVKLGLQRVCPHHIEQGLREPITIIASEKSHYTRLNISNWMGLGTDHLLTIPCQKDNAIDLLLLDQVVRKTLQKKRKIACLIVTLGTTDAFGIDPLSQILTLREKWVHDFPETGNIHIHADAVIGWAWLFFKNYDFNKNPLQFSAAALTSLQHISRNLRSIHQADSIGIDFHKTGYCPYISSLFLIKNQQVLSLIGRQRQLMPYLYHHGDYHPGTFTLECSRSGSGILAALGSLRLLGTQGFQVLVGHTVEMAERLREALQQLSSAAICNNLNCGPVVLFRLYPPPMHGPAVFQKEISGKLASAEIAVINRFNQEIFQDLHQRMLSSGGSALSWTDEYTRIQGTPLSALKAYFLNPFTRTESVEHLVSELRLMTSKHPLRQTSEH